MGSVHAIALLRSAIGWLTSWNPCYSLAVQINSRHAPCRGSYGSYSECKSSHPSEHLLSSGWQQQQHYQHSRQAADALHTQAKSESSLCR